jgi:hypothetical protein
MGSFPLLLSGWATATAGGLFLFLFLAPRRRREEEPVLAMAGVAAEPAPEPAPSPEDALPPAAVIPPDEVGVPRWLRPSVRAARQGNLARSQRGPVEDS